MKTTIKFLTLCVVLTGVSIVAGAQTNYKIHQMMTMAGDKSESTIYVRGTRKRTQRSTQGIDVTEIEQCDLKRNIKVNDKKKLYLIESLDLETSAETKTNAPKTNSPKDQSPKPKTTKGGIITMVSNITDTGERKQMFGLTARHIKTSMHTESSPDACSPQDMKTETDGWYVDLATETCPIDYSKVMLEAMRDTEGGCQDQYKSRTTGTGKTGFPLTETTTQIMSGQTSTINIETLEFSKAPLDQALFDIPAGYKLAANDQELYGFGDMSAMMQNKNGNDDDEEKPKNNSNKNNPTPPVNNSSSSEKKAGTVRVGVIITNSSGGENVSMTNLQSFLTQKLTGGNVEAVLIFSEAEARTSNCDYLLTSNFSKLKQSTASKIGGMFGKVTGGNPNAMKNYDVQVDFTLVSLKDGKTVLKNKAADKSNSDLDKAAESALKLEAEQIMAAIQNNL